MKYKLKQLAALIGTTMLGSHSVVASPPLESSLPTSHSHSGNDSFWNKLGIKTESNTVQTRSSTRNSNPAGRLGFSQANYTVPEEEYYEEAKIIVSRIDCSSSGSPPISVSYTSSDGTATENDYSTVSGTLTWRGAIGSSGGDGDCEDKWFRVPIFDDSVAEADETIHLKLSDPTGGVEIEQSEAVLTILDNDTSAIGFTQTHYTVNEYGNPASITTEDEYGHPATITVERTDCVKVDGYLPPASVYYYTTAAFVVGTIATSGSDFNIVAGKLSWDANECGTLAIKASIFDDSEEEKNEVVGLRLHSPTRATINQRDAILTIIDDESSDSDIITENSIIAFAQEKYNVAEGDSDGASIQVNRLGCHANSPAVSVSYASSNGTASSKDDYGVVSGNLKWGVKGDCNPKYFKVTPVDDAIFEENETVSLELRTATGDAVLGTNQAILTIKDNDPPPNQKPFATFTVEPQSGAEPLIVSLDAKDSFDPDGKITDYQWLTSDNQEQSGSTANLTFDTAGTHTITLTVVDNENAKASAEQTVVVGQSLTAAFTVTPIQGNAPLTVTLDASDSFPQENITTYEWKSSDGQVTSGRTGESFIFRTPGKYVITLNVTDKAGTTDSTQKTVMVEQPALLAAFTATPTKGNAPLTVTLDASESFPANAIMKYDWQTTDGQVTSGRTGESFIFKTPGKYVITLTVTNQEGVTNKTYKTVIVNSKPVARFMAIPNVVKPSSPTVQLDANDSFDADGTVVDYQWEASDGQTASGKQTSLLFKEVGQYEIRLQVTDNDGQSSNMARQTITVEAEASQLNPVAIIDADETDLTLRIVKLSAKRSTDIDGTIEQYQWTTVPDNQTATGEEVTLTFAEDGEYQVTLMVTDNDGLTAQDNRTLAVGETVLVEFDGLKPFYQLGDLLQIDLVENVNVKSRFHRVDLWVAIQIPGGQLLFRTPFPLIPFDLKPQAFKESLETMNVTHRLLDFEVVPGLSGTYTFYALYVDEGQNPITGNYRTIQRSNLAIQTTTILDNALRVFLENLYGAENVKIDNEGVVSIKIAGNTYRGKLDQHTQPGNPPANGLLTLTPIEDVNGDGKTDFEIVYPNGRTQMLYYLGKTQK